MHPKCWNDALLGQTKTTENKIILGVQMACTNIEIVYPNLHSKFCASVCYKSFGNCSLLIARVAIYPILPFPRQTNPFTNTDSTS